MKVGQCLKIRTLPTCPVHAMLDELRGYRDYVLIIVLKSNDASKVKRKKAAAIGFGQTE